ncbi:hypothetical protein HDU79_006921 [Rhizoclosmatium sp. JEL0117]|nr:hypothetical protein HDU79_006921 [Rhizoclosmatium sp. JEL0117]
MTPRKYHQIMQGDSATAPAAEQTVHIKPLKSSVTASTFTPQTIHGDLTSLAQELTQFKRHGTPQFDDIKAFAERIWRANLAYETALAKLEREKRMLTKQMDTIWGSFDTLIKPLWRVDDAIVPLYDSLAAIRLHLEQLHLEMTESTSKQESDRVSSDLTEVQKKLHGLEEAWVVDGKFVPPGWVVGGKVPGGQAIVANLLAKCYRSVRTVQELDVDPVVDKTLVPTQLRLESVVKALKQYKTALFNNEPVEPLELTSLQLHVDAIANLQKDGHFVDTDHETSEILKGQATLQELLEEAYDLVHQCLVETEAKEDIANRETKVGDLVSRVAGVLDSLSLKSTEGVLGSAPALHSFQETLNEGYGFVKQSAVESVEGAATLASLLRSGLASLGKSFAMLEPMDETLVPVRDRLVALKKHMISLRNDRDGKIAGNIRSGVEEWEDFGGYHEVRKELEELEALDLGRDEMGRFLSKEGGAPLEGQKELKTLLEECFVLAYELL